MAKYAVVIELTTVEQQRIEIKAKSPIDAQDKIKELMNSSGRHYSHFTFKRITAIKE